MTEPQEEPASGSLRNLHLSSGHLVPAVGLLTTQVILSADFVLVGAVLASGVDTLFHVYAHDLATFMILSPLATCVERGNWPDRLGGKLALQLVLVSLGGMALVVLYYTGIQKTSPAIAAAMSNLGPGLVFLIARCWRLEKFDVKCRYSAAKAMGTLLCLGGVIAVGLLQQAGDSTNPSPSLSRTVGVSGAGASREWITGCIFLFLSVFIASCATILQASALKDLPAPLSLTAITSLMGATFTMVFQLLCRGKLDSGNYTIRTTLLATYFVLSCAVTSLCVAFQTWCIRQQGPVFMSMFSPIGTVTSVVLSAVMLGKFLTFGSLAGVFVMIIGLYTVLWAKRNECPHPLFVDEDQDDGNEVIEENGAIDDRGLKKSLLTSDTQLQNAPC